MTESKATHDTPRPKNWVTGISDVEFESAFAPGEIIQNVGHIDGDHKFLCGCVYHSDYNYILNVEKRDRISAYRNQNSTRP